MNQGVAHVEELLESLVQIRDGAEQRAFISSSATAPSEELIESLSLRIRHLCPKDPSLAETLAETNLFLASVVGSPRAQAFACRSRAHVLYAMKRCAEARPVYDQAIGLFESIGLEQELGRTLCAQLENLTYLGLYDDALQLAERSRRLLEMTSDTPYLATLDIALGNLFYRLNNYAESLIHYDRAEQTLANTENHQGIAAVGLNRAQVLTDMNRFDEAIQSFEITKQYCERHGLKLWSAIADSGVAYMNFARGHYSAALRILEGVRRKHEELGDARRIGLCDLDRAEIYLQLNLFEEAARLAGRAFETFDRLSNRYEAAKCLTFRGIAEWKLSNDHEAERAFLGAREMFTKEGNITWVAIVDLCRAQLLLRQKHFAPALALAWSSAEAFEKQELPVRAALAFVILSLSSQELGQHGEAIGHAQRALSLLQDYHAPWVSFQCYNTLGRLKEIEGAGDEAERLYLQAIDELESLRGSIRLDELRMSFGRDKYQVYENIVDLKVRKDAAREAFDFVERSKSRTLIDLLERNLETLWESANGESTSLQRVRKLREELNILYDRLNRAGGVPGQASSQVQTKEEIARREDELVSVLRELGSEKSGWASLETMQLPSLEEIQQMLGPDEVLMEYYLVGDLFHVFVVGRDDFHVVPGIASTREVRKSLKGLNFQLSKFHLHPSYVETHAQRLLDATRSHLHDLYRQLLEPARPLIGDRSLVVVPHHVLHYVPFHALHDGAHFVVDTRDVVYSASASVLKICRQRKVQRVEEDLVLGVPDELTPHIYDEVRGLQSLLPKARIFVGAEATMEQLRRLGPTAGKLHIAAHGIFRGDNPMFSSIRLGDSWLNLFDIFNLQLGAELTTLSACETGMSAVYEGDELLGLARGFLYAGTPSLVVSLWTVSDRSTAELMQRFYKGLHQGLSKPKALREAMLAVKREFPHPYYWAPFILMGKS